MKVLFSLTYYHPYVSGLTLAASRWAEGLKKKGHHVTILCMSGRGDGVVAAKQLVRVHKGFLSWDWLGTSWQLVRKNDTVVVNLPEFEGVVPAIMGKLFGKKIIAIYHCEVVATWLVQRVLELSHMMTLYLADEVVTYTRDYADASRVLKALRSLKKKIKITYIVPPIPKPKENKTLTKKLQYKIGDAECVVGVAARLAAEKGIEYLLDALPLFRGTIVVAGSLTPVGEAAYKEKIMSLVSNFKKRVIFLGSIKPRDMGSFYRLLDVLVLPSINSTEAFGMVQVEAMKWGVPVVASDLPGVRVPIQKTGMGIVVPPRDPKKLAEAIIKIIDARNAYIKDISKEFSPELSIRNFKRLLLRGQNKEGAY